MRLGKLALGTALLALSACSFQFRAGSGGANTGGAGPQPVVASNPSNPTPAPAPAPPMTGQGGAAGRPIQSARLLGKAVGRIPTDPGTKVVVSPGTIFGGPETTAALRGHIFFIPDDTQKFPDLSGRKPDGVLYTNSLDVAARDFKEGFPGVSERVEWFAIRYDGKFTVANAGEYFFHLNSDDGSLLYIDDKLVVDNDGRHSPRIADGRIALEQGEHTIRVDYFQALRWVVALQLYVTNPAGDSFAWKPAF